MTMGLYWFGTVAVALGGLVLLAWALFSDRSRGRKRCPKCWYAMDQSPSRRCPECGHEAKLEKHLYRTRRRWKWVMASVLPFLLAGFLALQPKVQSDGRASIMPMIVLAMCLHLEDNEWVFEEIVERYPVFWKIALHETIPDDEPIPGSLTLRIMGVVTRSLALDENRRPDERSLYTLWAAFAASQIGEKGTPRRTADAFHALLDDSESLVRYQAMSRIPDVMEPAEAIAMLQSLATHEQTYLLTIVAAMGDVLLESGIGLQPIIEMYHRDSNHIPVRTQVIRVLGEYAERGGNAPDAIDLIATAIEDSNPSVRRAAVWARLRSLSSDELADMIVQLGTKEDTVTRSSVAEYVLTKLGPRYPSGINKAVFQWLHDEYPQIRQVALAFFTIMRTGDFIGDETLLRELAQSDDISVSRIANSHLNRLVRDRARYD